MAVVTSMVKTIGVILTLKSPCRSDTVNPWYSLFGISSTPIPIPMPRGVMMQKAVRYRKKEGRRTSDWINSKLMENAITHLCTRIAAKKNVESLFMSRQ